jgi:hypothetical protein
MQWLRYNYWIILVFVVAMVSSFIVQQASTASNLKKGCISRNEIRVEMNDRIPAHLADTRGLTDFLARAEKARLSEHTALGRKAAADYDRIRVYVLANARFRKLPLDKC